MRAVSRYTYGQAFMLNSELASTQAQGSLSLMAEIETPRGPRPPPAPSGGGEEATAGSALASALGVCCGGCLCIFGLVFAAFIFFPYGIGLGFGALGVLMSVVGGFILYWTCGYAQRHNRPV